MRPASRRPNNGVDQVRALRDEAVYSPAAVGKRVYIVDEVHMLTGNVHGRDPLKRKLLSPGFDGGRYLVQLRSGQNEHQMLRRLLQNFQQAFLRRLPG